MTKLKHAQAKIALWRKDPVQFIRDEFGADPDEWQKDFLNNYRDYARSGAKACKGPGKTTALAWACWHFLICYSHPKIAAVSISGDNLRDGLWAEMAKWQQKGSISKGAFTWRAERIYCNDHPETWFMSARKWAKDATGDQQANTLAGLHADNIMFACDEAGGIPDAVMAAAEAALANAGSEANPNARARLLITGNPTHLSGPLYRACTKEASLWHMIEITGDPDDPKRSPRINKQWAQEQITKYGRDNAWVLVNVFGKFPPASINALLGPDDIEAAQHRVLPPSVWMYEPKILGIDVALQGADQTCITPRQGPVIFKQKLLRQPEPKLIAGVVAVAMRKWQPDGVFIDNTGGFGSGVISWLRDWGYAVTDVQFSGKANDAVYANKRAEMHIELAHWVKAGGCLPDDPELKEEATAQTYTHYKSQLIMTTKDQIKEELGRSYDRWDSAALTFAYPVLRKAIAGVPLDVQNRGQSSDYDPMQAQHGIQEKEIDYNPLAL